jgi:hypothetical protein
MACLRFCPGRMLKFWLNCEIWTRDEAGTAWISEWAIEDFGLLPFSLRQMPHGCRRVFALDMWTISVQFRGNRDIYSCRLSLHPACHAWCESITNSTWSSHDDVTNNTTNSPWTFKITPSEESSAFHNGPGRLLGVRAQFQAKLPASSGEARLPKNHCPGLLSTHHHHRAWTLRWTHLLTSFEIVLQRSAILCCTAFTAT